MKRSCLVLLMVALSSSSAVAQTPSQFNEQQLAFFETKIRPVLVEHCYECHAAGSKIIQGGLRVDNRAGLIKGGDTGAALVPGKADQSLIIKALKGDGLDMPPKGKLSESIIKDFEAWVSMGGPDPREAKADEPKKKIDLEEGRKHWAFRQVGDPPLPSITRRNWPISSADHFILARLEAAGLIPSIDADRYTWLRRVSLDLTGLPPTPTEIELFVRDNSPSACEAVVDRLLASRAFGERWARHWLDLTGYADMAGTSNNVYAEHAWRYRDYLINSYHIDKPFDRFVREQIAGDLLPAGSSEEQAENITATGFLVVGDVEIVEPEKAKMEADHIDSQVSKIGTAFLGMTLGCARCHDHKFDPIELPDYYGIAGILRSSSSTHKVPYGVWSMLNSTDLPETPAQLAARKDRESEHEKKLEAMKSERDTLEADKKLLIAELSQLEKEAEKPVIQANSPANSETLSKPATPENNTPEQTAELFRLKKESLVKRRDELTEKLKRVNAAIQHGEFFRSMAPKALAIHDSEQPADMPVYIRGNPYSSGKVMSRGVLRVASWENFPAIPPAQSGRVQLADWLADRRNPLTARVTVNRIWQKLFGEGLSRSVDYFGVRGEAPSHPDLLDHLASRFMQNGWSQKQLIRSLVLSRTYRQSSANNAASLKIDPDNRLCWRMNRQRLEAETIRDGLLAVSEELLASQGGPALVLEEVENCNDLRLKGINPPGYNHRKSRQNQEFQRSIYLPVMRTNTTSLDRIRSHFDFVNPAQIAGQRSQTVVPTQSLFVMNNELFRKRAKVIADRLIAETPHRDARLDRLWLRIVNRPITTAERAAATTFLEQLESTKSVNDPAKNESLAWLELCHSLLASNEFLFRL